MPGGCPSPQAKSGFGGTEWMLSGLFSEGTKRGLSPNRVAEMVSGAGEGSSGKGDVFWGLVEAALLVAEMQPGNARALENGSRWLKTLFAVGPHAPPWRLRVLVEAQAQLVKAAQRKPANTPAPARGLNEMVLTLAKAPNEAPSGLLEVRAQFCISLKLIRRAACELGQRSDQCNVRLMPRCGTGRRAHSGLEGASIGKKSTSW